MISDNKFRIQRGFQRAAEAYDNHALLQREVAQYLFQTTHPLFPAGGRILDAGCGTGYFHELARSYGHRWAIHQLDLAFAMCQRAAEYASPPEYGGTFTVNGDIETLPFAAESFDGIFSSLALQWMADPVAAFGELYRILRRKGVLTLSTLAPGTLKELDFVFSCIDTLPHINPFVPQEALLELVKNIGFRPINVHLEHKTLFHPDSRHLMKALKGVGAGYKGHKGSRVSYNKEKFALLERLYQQHFQQEQGLPASWNVLYITLEK